MPQAADNVATLRQELDAMRAELDAMRQRLAWFEGIAEDGARGQAFRDAVAEGLADAREGRIVAHEAVMADVAARRRSARNGG